MATPSRMKGFPYIAPGLLVALLVTVAVPGTASSRSSLTPYPAAPFANGPVLTVKPASGPAGSFVSLSAVGFDPSYVKGGTASISFDNGSPIDSQKLVPCTTAAGAAPSTGFGVDCAGATVLEQVPAGAQPGARHVFTALVGELAPSVAFTVTSVDTATPSPTQTATASATISATATLTSTPIAVATGTATATLTATAAKTVSSGTATATATPSASKPPVVPVVSGPLPLYRLSRTSPPLSFTLHLLDRVAPRRSVVTINDQNGRHIVAAFDNAHLASYVDLVTGDAALFPALPSSGKVPVGTGKLASVAQSLLLGSGLIPQDATRARLNQPIVGIASSSRQGTRGVSGGIGAMAFFPVTRLVGTYSVFGPGSTAVLALDGTGSLRGFLRRWRTATNEGSIMPTRSAGEVLQSIRTQLAKVGAGLPVTLDGIALTYYDGNGAFLEPAYRFTATVHAHGSVRDDHIIGYEAVSRQEPEPLPTIQSSGTTARQAQHAPLATITGKNGVGRYVVSGPMPTWSMESAAFQQSISSFWPGVAGQLFGHPVVSPQRLHAQVLALDAPGSPGQFTTDSYCCGVVKIAGLSTLSAGLGAGSSLAFLIAHTPALIPSPADAASASGTWLRVFGGLHAVVGYSTDIYSNDGVLAPFGADLAMGAPVVSAWLTELAADTAYQDSASSAKQPLGRASTLSACGHENDSMYDATSLRPPTCLLTWGAL
jgi:hypothetical protein